MQTFKKKESIIILTYDLNLNRTFINRYFSFIRALNNHNISVKGVGIDFSYKPHPINNLDKLSIAIDIRDDIITIQPKNLNFIQRLLSIFDSYNLPFFIKKYLLATHIFFYKKDQWSVDISDLDILDQYHPSIIVAGGSSGIIASAFMLAKKHNAKLVLDYRDPLNFGYNLLETNRFVNIFKRTFTLNQEINFLESANHIITVSKSLKLAFPKNIHHKISILENGSDFIINNAYFKKETHLNYFNIVYLGTIYSDQLLDQTFFKALKQFIRRNNIQSDSFKLLFIGTVNNNLLNKIINSYELNDYVKITNRLTKDNLLDYLNNASLFLHLKYGNRKKIITSKQADYLTFRKPILLPISDNGDIAESIIKHKAGYVCENEFQIMETLELLWGKFIKGENLFINQPREFIESISRKKIAEDFVKLLTEN